MVRGASVRCVVEEGEKAEKEKKTEEKKEEKGLRSSVGAWFLRGVVTTYNFYRRQQLLFLPAALLVGRTTTCVPVCIFVSSVHE